MTKKLSKIAFIFLFTLGAFLGPLSVVRAQNTPDNVPDYSNRLQNCVFAHPTDGTGTFEGCLVSGFYYLILVPSGWFAYQSGRLFDFFMAYSLDSNSYTGGNGDFVNQGWAVIRDIANVLFIFTLLYIAITHILQAGTSGTKKLLTGLIVAALLINFSLFFSKIIIDGGNILARVFYNNIEVTYDDHPDGSDIHTISQALVAKVNPQAILGSDLFTPILAPGQAPGVMSNGYAFFIMLVAAFVNITIGIVFISTFLLFAARVIGLWFLMIFSPIAFASLALPNGGSFFGDFGWKGWISNILKLSFMAPVFLFFLFLLIMFLQIVMSQPILAGNTDTAHRLMGTLIPFIAIVVILQRAKSIAGDMAGEFGKSLTSAVGKLAGSTLTVTGAVTGAAIGASAFAGRYFIGGAATRELRSGVHQENVRLNNERAEEAKKAGDREAEKKYRMMAMSSANRVKQLDRRSNASFDVRKTSWLQKDALAGKVGKLAGGYAQQLGGEAFGGEKLKLDLGKAKDTSRKKYEAEREKKALDEAKLYDTGSQNEARLATIGYAARKGMAAKDEVIEHIDTYMQEIRNNVLMTDKEKEARLKAAGNWRERAVNATKDEELVALITKEKIDNPKLKDLREELQAKTADREKFNEKIARKKELEDLQAKGPLLNFQEEELKDLSNLDDEIKKLDDELLNLNGSIKQEIKERGEKVDGVDGLEDQVKKYAGGGRSAFANVVEAREGNGISQLAGIYGNFNPKTRQDYSSFVADRIRKGEKNDGTKDLIKKLAKESGLKIDDGHGHGDDKGKGGGHGGGDHGGGGGAHPPAPKPAPKAPSGGGGGGDHGGGGHH